jgi:hypothetical protein
MVVLSKHLPLFLALICSLLIGCGKDAPNKLKKTPDVIRPPQVEVNTYLEKQDVNCEPNQVCPNYIAKIVIKDGTSYRFCTGFLTDQDTVATSASCLPDLLRLNGQDCSRDVFFYFPKTSNRQQESARCQRVSLVSPLEGKDPVLWRENIAFLEIAKPMPHRRQAQIVREGVQNNKDYTVWMVDQQGDYSAILKRSTCVGVHGSYVNPLVANESSPNMLFANCGVTNSFSGAPVIDSKGKVRGMLSQEMDQRVRTYLESTGLLTQPLQQMVHGSNFACAATPYDIDILDEKECLKDLTYSIIDRSRADMLSLNMLFSDLRKRYEESLQGVSKFIRFGVRMIPNGEFQETEIYPKCFRPLNEWIDTITNTRNIFVEDVVLPVRVFRRTMDASGRIIAQTIEGSNKATYFQFSLKFLRSSRRSSVLMWFSEDNNNVRTFQNISEECPSTLLF